MTAPYRDQSIKVPLRNREQPGISPASRKVIALDMNDPVFVERDLQQFVDRVAVAETIKGKSKKPLLHIQAHQARRHVDTYQTGVHLLDSPWPRARAMATSSGLRHSSTRNFTRARGHRERASPKPLECPNGVVSSAADLAPDRPAHKSERAEHARHQVADRP